MEPSVADIRTALSGPLPGHGDFTMLSGYRRPTLEESLALTPPLRESAVLILLHRSQGEIHTVMMERSTYEGVHSGQIAFPGGKREPLDRDLHATALREFREETGATPSGIEVLGELSRIPITPSRTIVTPVVGWCETLGPMTPDPREVGRLIDATLAELMRPDILKHTDLRIDRLGTQAEVAYWDVQGHVVWGATALMIAELRQVIHVAAHRT